jgi:hypothetical protein
MQDCLNSGESGFLTGQRPDTLSTGRGSLCTPVTAKAAVTYDTNNRWLLVRPPGSTHTGACRPPQRPT